VPVMEACNSSRMELLLCNPVRHLLGPVLWITFPKVISSLSYGNGQQGRLTSASNISRGIIRYADDLSTGRSIHDNIPLRSDGSIRLGVKNQDAADTLFGATGNSLGKILAARFGAIEFDRKCRIQFRCQKRGSGYDQISWLGPDAGRVLLPVLTGVPFGQLNFVRARVVGIDGKIALVGFSGIDRPTRRKQRCQNKKQRERAVH
jgi:hypothetical protein